jgi:hypothetical protein
MSGGDLTIDDGEYCDRCRMADALDCMAHDYCHRRALARLIMKVDRGLARMLAMDGEGVLTIGKEGEVVEIRREDWQAIIDDAGVRFVIINAASGSIEGAAVPEMPIAPETPSTGQPAYLVHDPTKRRRSRFRF